MTSLMTKRRPQDFEDIYGQDHVVNSLIKIRESGKWAPAYLFVGQSGGGKTTTARIIAKHVGCDPVNVIEVDAASHSTVDKMRELTAGLKYKGFGETQAKMIIIDEIHRLSKQAWDVLLKPIEEPIDGIYFCFCTTEPDKVPKTIKTRCISYTFKPVSNDDLCDLIEDTIEEEGLDVPEKAIPVIARHAQGSPRQALADLTKVNGAKTVAEVKEMLEEVDGTAEGIEFARMVVLGKGLSWQNAVKLLSKINAEPESIRLMVINYANAILSSTKSIDAAEPALAVLEAFSRPCNPSEKMAPIYRALGELLLEE